MAADCRVRRDGVSGVGVLGRGLFESRGVGCLEAICLAGTSLDAGKGLRVRRVAGCSGIGLKPGGGRPLSGAETGRVGRLKGGKGGKEVGI